MIERVGVLGAGVMGMGIAVSAARGGFEVVVCDIDPAREQLAGDAGMGLAASPCELVERSDAVFIVVVDSGQIDTVLRGPQGLLSALSSTKLVLLCSTISPGDSTRFAAQIAATGAAVLDAPISGGPARARAGTMSMMLAGDPVTLAHAQPVLDAVSGKRFVISDRPGDAAKAKLVNNLMAGIHLMAGAEAIALAECLGLDPQQMVDLISASSGQSWMFNDRIPRALAGDFEPRAQAHVLTKDVRLANEAAEQAGLALPLGALVKDLFQATCDGGWRTEDDAAVLKYYRKKFSQAIDP